MPYPDNVANCGRIVNLNVGNENLVKGMFFLPTTSLSRTPQAIHRQHFFMSCTLVNLRHSLLPKRRGCRTKKVYHPVGTAYIIGQQDLLNCANSKNIEIDFPSELQDAESCEEYDLMTVHSTNLEEVDAIQDMRFNPTASNNAPADLYQNASEYQHIFEHSASASFVPYILLFFWYQVVHETNRYAAIYDITVGKPFTLNELMQVLEPVDLIGGNTTSLDGIISFNRFKLLRQCLSFNASPSTLHKDAAARILSLPNLLKTTGDNFIVVERGVALDEVNVSYRSRQGRHMIVFNAMKPTGKYHLPLYEICCSSTGISLDYKLHCYRIVVEDQLNGVIGTDEAQALGGDLIKVSKIRQLLLEVARSIFGINRVVNTDNYYSSVQILQALRLKGCMAEV
ncbi:Transposase [Phytophthora palmivora]|uniref:Transposase n=1 Tax=Phytophthora palmivora TaxID=4796 RepID=A0A2P4YEF9_9STRA|nr:Transposase [Phytophthora palmivora]